MSTNFIFNITGQELSLRATPVVADRVNYLTAEFHFSDDWKGHTKYAHFEHGNNVYDIMLVDDKIPATAGLNLTKGTWVISVHGAIMNGTTLKQRIPTNTVVVRVKESGYKNGEPFPSITTSVGEQIVAQATAKANAAALSASTASTKASEASAVIEILGR